MREYLNRAVLANMIAMLRADIKGAIWMADDEDECRFYQQLASMHARVLHTLGHSLDLIKDARKQGIAGVVASVRGGTIIDGEYDNVFRPSAGDTASLALLSPSAERVLQEIAGGEWCRAAASDIGSVIRRSVALAWQVAQVDKMRTDAGDVMVARSLADLVDWNGFKLMPSFGARLGVQAIGKLDAVLEAVNDDDEFRRVIIGVDGRVAMELIASAVEKYRPRGIRAKSGGSSLGPLLNVAFDFETFEADDIFWQIRRWQRLNRNFQVLRTWRMSDPLGVLWDQRYWHRDLRALLQNMSESMAAFKMDLDNFKTVNEALGHAGGDEAIREYMQCVDRVLGSVGEAYRRGGDEVVVLAPGLGFERAETLAEQLRNAIEVRFKEWAGARGLGVAPTASIGLVELPPGVTCEHAENLMDSAQSQAKISGKNCVVSIPHE